MYISCQTQLNIYGLTKTKGATGNLFIVKFNNIPFLLINGCSIGIVPLGINAKTDKSHTDRLYTISNAKYDETTKKWSCD